MEKVLVSVLLFALCYSLPIIITKIVSYFKSKKQVKGD